MHAGCRRGCGGGGLRDGLRGVEGGVVGWYGMVLYVQLMHSWVVGGKGCLAPTGACCPYLCAFSSLNPLIVPL